MPALRWLTILLLLVANKRRTWLSRVSLVKAFTFLQNLTKCQDKAEAASTCCQAQLRLYCRWIAFREEALKHPDGQQVLVAGRPGTAGVAWITQQMSDMLKVRAAGQGLTVHLAMLWHWLLYCFSDILEVNWTTQSALSAIRLFYLFHLRRETGFPSLCCLVRCGSVALIHVLLCHLRSASESGLHGGC